MSFTGNRFAPVDRDDWIRQIPDLVVEVLSPSTQDYDCGTKRQTYAQLGVAHYWIVDPRLRTITQCVRQSDGSYHDRTIGEGEVFHPRLFPDLEVDLAQIFQ